MIIADMLFLTECQSVNIDNYVSDLNVHILKTYRLYQALPKI